MNKLNLKWVSDSIGDDYKKWGKGDTVLIEAQTGTGKTYFIKNDLLDSLMSHERLLLVCNRTNLKRQLKKDLLKKYNQPIPDTLNELDEITTIANKVTITSYHAISNIIKESLYDTNAPKYEISQYDYIVMDECHFLFADGGFNNKARFAFEELVTKYYPFSIKVFISATMYEVREPIIHNVNRIKNNGFGLDDAEIHEYSTGTDYSYVRQKYFKKMDSIINVIKNDKSDEKWLIFISDIERDWKKILEAFGEDNCSLIKSGTVNDELNSIINNGKFKKKILVCTKAMDNGINIKDEKLKNIVIMTWDRITFIQMLGRKRIDIENPEEVNLYIPTRYKKSFLSKLNGLLVKKEELNLHQTNKTEFYKKYDNDLKDFKDVNDLFYRDVMTGKIKANLIGMKRLDEDIKFAEYIIEKFETDKKYAFIREQLSWLGLSDSNCEVNLLEDVLIEDEVTTLDEFLKNLFGEKLFEKEQRELKEFITKDFDTMISKLQGRHKDREPGLKILNKLLVICDIPYIIKTNKIKKTVDGVRKNITYWSVEEL
ncbi:DEAD/DEAH box helicase [Neobacillus mesonae]|uniref:DEAD/DEAH box helicase n=1 Tax=Neobacillus mesonae TaxID=1193713 RepID=UPI0025723072|nr:DEAD/DEAH box helicase family protein [Neobacillus mesonae]